MWSWQQLLDWVTAENPRRERDELLQAFEGLHGYPITMGNTLQVRAKVRTFINAKIAEVGADTPSEWDPHNGRRAPNGENGDHQNGQENQVPPVPEDPETPVEPQGLPQHLLVAWRFSRKLIFSEQAINEVLLLLRISGSAAARAALLHILEKLRDNKLDLHDADVQMQEIALAFPAQPEQPEVPPQQEGPPKSEEDDVSNHDPNTGSDADRDQPDDVHVDRPWRDRSNYAAAPMTKLARIQIENDARRGLLSEENETDLLSQIDEEEAAIMAERDDHIKHLRDIQNVAAGGSLPPSKPPLGGKGGGGNNDTPRRPFANRPDRGPRDPGRRSRDRDQIYVDDSPRRSDSNPLWPLAAIAAVLLIGFLAWLLIENWDEITDEDNGTPAAPATTATQPVGGGDPGGNPPATTTTPVSGGAPGGVPSGQAPAAWTAPQPGSDLNNETQFTKVPIDVAKEGQWNHRVFNMRLFNADNNWGGADSWFVSLVTGANSGGAWTSHGNPGQIVYRGNNTHINWCLGVLTTAQYKDQFMAGASGNAGINVRIAPNSVVTVKTASGQVVNQATSDAGDITIILPDSGVVTICVDYTTAAPTHESLVWWGPYDRSENINTVDGR